MSLTSEISTKNSWVNRFFKARLPHVNDFVKREGSAVKSMSTEVALLDKGAARTIGTAFDYRLRLHYRDDLSKSRVMNHGVARMQLVGSGLGAGIDSLWAKSTQSLLQRPPIGSEDLMARTSVVLAWIHDGFRSGGRWSSGMMQIAASLDNGEPPTWHGYAAAVDPDVACEVTSLMQLATPRLPVADVICGPVFDGSPFVKGADADMIVDGCLYDVKTTAHPRDRLPVNVRQLLGYALLDWYDGYRLDRVGFYFARQGRWKDWPLEQLVRETTGDAHATLAGLRDQFRALAEEHSPRRRWVRRIRSNVGSSRNPTRNHPAFA